MALIFLRDDTEQNFKWFQKQISCLISHRFTMGNKGKLRIQESQIPGQSPQKIHLDESNAPITKIQAKSILQEKESVMPESVIDKPRLRGQAKFPPQAFFLCDVAWRVPTFMQMPYRTSTCGRNIHHLFPPSNILWGQDCPLMDKRMHQNDIFLERNAFDSYPQKIRMTPAVSLSPFTPYNPPVPFHISQISISKRFFHIYT